MVSSALSIDNVELVRALARIKRDHSNDPAYLEIRPALPAEWPM